MIKTTVILVAVMLFAPAPFLGQGAANVTPIEALNLADIADDSIVVLSKDESGVPGVVRMRYAYVNSLCPDGLQLIDYYGPEFDPNNPALRRYEFQLCAQATFDSGGDAD